MADKNKFPEIGRIINTHGVRGEVKIEPWCDSAADFCRMKRVYLENGKELSVINPRIMKGNFIICSLSEIKTLDEALQYKNKVIYANRDDLDIPEGSVLVCDMIELPVIDNDNGKVYGTLSDVLKYTSQEIYEIKTPDGKTVLMPAVHAFIKRIDTENGIFITPIDGFFD